MKGNIFLFTIISVVFLCCRSGNDEFPVPRDAIANSQLAVPYPDRFVSDVEDTSIISCQKYEPFALGRCWDSIYFSDQGEFALVNKSDNLRVVAVSGAVDAAVLSRYSGLADQSGVLKLTNSRIEQLKKNGSRDYWFLPLHMAIASQTFDDGRKHATLVEASFRTGQWKQFKGRARLCNKEFELPIKRPEFEAACKVTLDDNFEASVKGDGVTVTLSFYGSARDAPQELLENMFVGSISIRRASIVDRP